MKQVLTDADRSILDRRIAITEKQTRVQVVLASVLRSDSYAEIPWKAFAIGASLASLVLIFLNLFVPGWITNALILSSLAAIMAAGALFALLSVLIPGFGKLFLSPQRIETECMQYAESLFLSNELFSTEERRGVLILVSQFERQVVILPDKGVRDLLNEEVLDVVISIMTGHLKRSELKQAMVSGLEGIHTALGFEVPEWEDRDELSNEIIEEDGV